MRIEIKQGRTAQKRRVLFTSTVSCVGVVEEDWRQTPLIVKWWVEPASSFMITRLVLLRLLGVVYFVAFLSTVLQGRALIGEHGLTPMRAYLSAVHRHAGAAAYVKVPTLFWLSDSDAALVVVALIGCALALAVVVGVTNGALMLALFCVQMSLYNVGQIFWGYGWEIQLLETGMIAAFLCPLRTWRPFASSPPLVVIWIMRWLIVRIMLGAGLIKLRGDPCWRELTCLVFHYETQPNPSPLSWVAHQMPAWAHTLGVLFNHVVELVAPFLVFGPRLSRRIAGVLFVTFQGALIASGNLSFLNWLTIVPALACFDDDFWVSRLRFVRRLLPKRFTSPLPSPPPTKWHRRLALGYAVVVAILSIGPTLNLFSSHQQMNASFDPLHLVNTYGAFGTVSRVRDEIVIEGTLTESGDGEDGAWEEYELPCKPGDPSRRPCIVSPYHYRLDWQMWFAAMSSYEEEPWIVELVDRLLRGERAVVEALFTRDPFAGRGPPKRIRARVYRYEFTRLGQGSAWWTRRLLTPADRPGGSEYMRPLALDDPELTLFLRAHRFP